MESGSVPVISAGFSEDLTKQFVKASAITALIFVDVLKPNHNIFTIMARNGIISVIFYVKTDATHENGLSAGDGPLSTRLNCANGVWWAHDTRDAELPNIP